MKGGKKEKKTKRHFSSSALCFLKEDNSQEFHSAGNKNTFVQGESAIGDDCFNECINLTKWIGTWGWCAVMETMSAGGGVGWGGSCLLSLQNKICNLMET